MLRKSSVSVLVAGMALLAVAPGCWIFFPPASPLAGTWAMTTQTATDLETFQLTFDNSGNLIQIVYRVTSSTTLTVDDPESITQVSGSDVGIAATFVGNGFVYNGRLQGTVPETVEGTATGVISVGGITVTLLEEPATLTKV